MTTHNSDRGQRWKSLRWRLPATISLFVVTVLAVIVWVAFREVEFMLTGVILRRSGYRVIEAASAPEGEALHLQHSGISLLVTDVVLPTASGPDLYQRLVLRDPKLKVLYMSGYTDDAVFRTGRLKPGESFIQKPFSTEGLRRKLREILDATP